MSAPVCRDAELGWEIGGVKAGSDEGMGRGHGGDSRGLVTVMAWDTSGVRYRMAGKDAGDELARAGFHSRDHGARRGWGASEARCSRVHRVRECGAHRTITGRTSVSEGTSDGGEECWNSGCGNLWMRGQGRGGGDGARHAGADHVAGHLGYDADLQRAGRCAVSWGHSVE